MAPKGSPIANRLAKPAGPGWNILTPTEEAIKVRQPPSPAPTRIAQHVVKGHVKQAQDLRDLPYLTPGTTEFPSGFTLLSRDALPAYWDTRRAQKLTGIAGNSQPKIPCTYSPWHTTCPF